jgi:metalloendopeptidase OMA1, mitochondrial
VQRVGMQIAKVADSDMPNAQWEFVVFDNKEPNAFALPGGKVGVHSGLLPVAKTEAGLATVIGHEIAHATARHGAERMSRQMVLAGGQELLAAGVGGSLDPGTQQLALMAYGVGATVGVELPFSRAQELEADRIGLTYMARAGYDPAEAIQFWERFRQLDKGGGGTPAFLRTHPLDDARIKQLRKWLPEAREEFLRSSLQR